MRILLTGASGQLGRELDKQFSQMGGAYKVLSTNSHTLDITNQQQVTAAIQSFKPDTIINCAAYTNVDGCESDEFSAFNVNAVGARNLSATAYDLGARIVHISTDYVFDGTGSTPKKEYDQVNPQTVYGKSKEFGERLVRETNPRHFIIRTAWLYGEGKNFVKTMLKLAEEQKVLKVVGDQIGTPTSTVDLAQCIIDLIQTDYYGTYHATCEGQCSWYDFAKKIFEIKGIDINVEKITSEQLSRPAKRPKYSVLDNFMLKLAGLNRFRYWEDALVEYLKK